MQLVTGKGERRRYSGGAKQPQRRILNAFFPSRIRQQFVECRTFGRGDHVLERLADHVANGATNEWLNGSGGVDDSALAVKFQEDIGPAESQGDKSITLGPHLGPGRLGMSRGDFVHGS